MGSFLKAAGVRMYVLCTLDARLLCRGEFEYVVDMSGIKWAEGWHAYGLSDVNTSL